MEEGVQLRSKWQRLVVDGSCIPLLQRKEPLEWRRRSLCVVCIPSFEARGTFHTVFHSTLNRNTTRSCNTRTMDDGSRRFFCYPIYSISSKAPTYFVVLLPLVLVCLPWNISLFSSCLFFGNQTFCGHPVQAIYEKGANSSNVNVLIRQKEVWWSQWP